MGWYGRKQLLNSRGHICSIVICWLNYSLLYILSALQHGAQPMKGEEREFAYVCVFVALIFRYSQWFLYGFHLLSLYYNYFYSVLFFLKKTPTSAFFLYFEFFLVLIILLLCWPWWTKSLSTKVCLGLGHIRSAKMYSELASFWHSWFGTELLDSWVVCTTVCRWISFSSGESTQIHCQKLAVRNMQLMHISFQSLSLCSLKWCYQCTWMLVYCVHLAPHHYRRTPHFSRAETSAASEVMAIPAGDFVSCLE